MTLGRTAKVVIGVLTIVVTLLPIIFSLLWAHAFSRFLAYPPSEMGGLRPFAGVLSSTEPFLLLATALSLGMAVFYAAHVIRNQDLPAYVRVLLLPSLVVVPYLSMPVYYFLCVLFPQHHESSAGAVAPEAAERALAQSPREHQMMWPVILGSGAALMNLVFGFGIWVCAFFFTPPVAGLATYIRIRQSKSPILPREGARTALVAAAIASCGTGVAALSHAIFVGPGLVLANTVVGGAGIGAREVQTFLHRFLGILAEAALELLFVLLLSAAVGALVAARVKPGSSRIPELPVS